MISVLLSKNGSSVVVCFVCFVRFYTMRKDGSLQLFRKVVGRWSSPKNRNQQPNAMEPQNETRGNGTKTMMLIC